MDLTHLSPETVRLALTGILASFRASVALVDSNGIILVTNPTWQDFQESNPLIRGLGPGDDYLAVCQTILTGSEMRLTTVALGIQSALKGKLPVLNLEYQQGESEALRWYGLQVTAPNRELGLPGVIIQADITEKMLLQRSLRRIENLFKITTENAADLIAILDTRKGTVFASPSHTWTLGYSKHELGRIDYAEIIHEEDRTRFKALLKEGSSRSLSRMVQFRVRAKDASIHLVECRVATVEGSSGDYGTLLLVGREITERNSV
jgi:PAS domain S-box-containing protein